MNYKIYEQLTAAQPPESRPSIVDFIVQVIIADGQQHPNTTKEIPIPSIFGEVTTSRNTIMNGVRCATFMKWDRDATMLINRGIRARGRWIVVTSCCFLSEGTSNSLTLFTDTEQIECDPRAVLELLPLAAINLPQYYGIVPNQSTITIFTDDFPLDSPIILDRADFVRHAGDEWLDAKSITLPFGGVSELVAEMLRAALSGDDACATLISKMDYHDVDTYFKILSYLGITRWDRSL